MRNRVWTVLTNLFFNEKPERNNSSNSHRHVAGRFGACVNWVSFDIRNVISSTNSVGNTSFKTFGMQLSQELFVITPKGERVEGLVNPQFLYLNVLLLIDLLLNSDDMH